MVSGRIRNRSVSSSSGTWKSSGRNLMAVSLSFGQRPTEPPAGYLLCRARAGRPPTVVLRRFSIVVADVSAAEQHAPPGDKEAPRMMRLWDQLGGARPGRPGDDDAWLSQYAEATAWWRRNRRGGQSPNHATPYLDLILPPCAAI